MRPLCQWNIILILMVYYVDVALVLCGTELMLRCVDGTLS